jgi:hypothetical protein
VKIWVIKQKRPAEIVLGGPDIYINNKKAHEIRIS